MYQTALREEIEELDIEVPQSDKLGSWSRQEHLLATIADLLNILKWQNENQGKKSGYTPAPKPISRPGVARKKKLDLAVMERMQAKREERKRLIDEEAERSDLG